jgi:hypothetical protein
MAHPQPLVILLSLLGLRDEHYEDIIPEISSKIDNCEDVTQHLLLLKQLFSLDNNWILELSDINITPFLHLVINYPEFELCFEHLASKSDTTHNFMLYPHHLTNEFLSILTKVVEKYPQFEVFVDFDMNFSDITLEQFVLVKELKKHCAVKVCVMNEF